MNKSLQVGSTVIVAILAVLTILGGRPYFFPETLIPLYGIDLEALDEVSVALLRHRGMMVSVIGFLLLPSIFSRSFGKIAIPMVIFSKAMFVLILYPHSAEVGSVYFDLVAIVLLIIIYVYWYLVPRSDEPARS